MAKANVNEARTYLEEMSRSFRLAETEKITFSQEKITLNEQYNAWLKDFLVNHPDQNYAKETQYIDHNLYLQKNYDNLQKNYERARDAQSEARKEWLAAKKAHDKIIKSNFAFNKR